MGFSRLIDILRVENINETKSNSSESKFHAKLQSKSSCNSKNRLLIEDRHGAAISRVGNCVAHVESDLFFHLFVPCGDEAGWRLLIRRTFLLSYNVHASANNTRSGKNSPKFDHLFSIQRDVRMIFMLIIPVQYRFYILAHCSPTS